MLGWGGRICTDDFQWWSAFLNYELAMLFFFIFWIPLSIAIGMAGYGAAMKVPFLRSPGARAIAAVAVVVLVFAATAIFTHRTQSNCTYF